MLCFRFVEIFFFDIVVEYWEIDYFNWNGFKWWFGDWNCVE